MKPSSIKLFRTTTTEAAVCKCGDPGPIFLINSKWWHLMDEGNWPAGTRMTFDFRNCAKCAPRYGKNTPPPVETVAEKSCDWGSCALDAVAWRWDSTLNEWLPVCPDHVKKPRLPPAPSAPPSADKSCVFPCMRLTVGWALVDGEWRPACQNHASQGPL